MFIRASTLLFPVLAAASLVAAAPEAVVARGGGTTTTCSNGNAYCCNQTFTANQASVTIIQALLGVVVNPIVGPLLGISCSPITVIGGVLQSTCTQQTVCCEGTQFNGLVNVGCNAISL
ncbi:hypothetical protein ID866_11903 [Astraeus odoratus]|nr:hypothetical protein ID866_11903 [Astraeus odoratus]